MQLPQAVTNEIHGALARGTPTVAMVGAWAWGFGPQALIWILTVSLLTLQLAYLIWKWRREAKRKPDSSDSAGA